MVKKKKKSKRNRRKFFTRLLIIAVFVYFIIMTIPVVRTTSARTIPVEKDDIEDIANSKGIILKNEHVYKAEAKGEISFSAKEGEKLKKNAKISEIRNEAYRDYENQLAEKDSEIEDYNQRISSQQEVLQGDLQKNQGEIDHIIKEVQRNVAEHNYEEVKRLKDRLLIISDKKDAISNEKTLIMEQLGTAMKQKSEIVSKMKQSNLIYYAGSAGIMSRNLDGYEEEYSAKKVDEYKLNDFKELENNKKIIKDDQEVDIGTPIFKVIESQQWFIMTDIDKGQVGNLKKGNEVSIMIDDSKLKVPGVVTKLDKSSKGNFAIIKLDRHLHDYYKKRYVNLKTIKSTYSGFKVPKKAVVDKDGKKGVFIKDISGVVKFREVKKLKELKDIILVEPVEVEGKDPLRLFDEVFIDGRKIKEGQLVNSKGVFKISIKENLEYITKDLKN